MPKLKLAIGAEAANVDATEGFSNYDGETPPKGVYPAVVKQIAFQQSKKGNPMLRAIVEIKAPKTDKRSKYNGYAMFEYLVIPESKEDEYYGRRVGDINALLDAMSGGNKAVRKALWGSQAVVSDDKDPKIVKIGPLDLKAKGGIPIKVNTRDEVEQIRNKETGETENIRRLRVNSYNTADEAAKVDEAPADEDDIDPSDIDPEEFDDDEAADSDDDIEPEADESDDADVDDADDADADSDDEDEADDVDGDDADEDDGYEDGAVDVAEIPDDEDEDEEPAVEEKPVRRRRKASF